MRWVLYLEQRRLERERDEVVRGSVGRLKDPTYLARENVFARLNGIFPRQMVSPVVALKAGHKISEYYS